MGQTVKSMASTMKNMSVEKIANTMEQFEKQFEDLDVKSGYMESAMDATSSMTTPPEEVDALIQVKFKHFSLILSHFKLILTHFE